MGGLTGCPADEEIESVSIFGEMTVGPTLGDPRELVAGAHLDAYDDTDTILSRGEEPWPGERPGYYRVPELPPESHVHLVAWDDEATLVPAILTAWTPPNDLFAFPGEIYALSQDWLRGTLALLSKDGVGSTIDEVLDPDHQGDPGFVLGGMADPAAMEGARVTLRAAGEPYETLYIDEIGIARADLLEIGPGGGFAIFGVPEGPVTIEVTLADGTDLSPFIAVVHEDSCTALYGLEVAP